MVDDLDFGATVRGYSPEQKVFRRYTLKRMLGRGGMGVVWLAHDDDLERDVALKFLPEIVANDAQSLKDLKRETRRSLELTHGHIVRIYDFVQDSASAAISMEFVAGDTLAQRKLEQSGDHFEWPQLALWVEELCDALAYAHERAKVVHRDLKPANLMLDADGQLKVADFGIAASVSDSVSRVSQSAGSSGTPVYMSPQQMMGEPPAVTDDIYSVGALLYELLTSRPPFYSGNVMMQVLNKEPERPAVRRKVLEITGQEIPAHVDEVIMACLAKEPGDRPQSMRDLARLLSDPLETGEQADPSVFDKPAPSFPVTPPSLVNPKAESKALGLRPDPRKQAEAGSKNENEHRMPPTQFVLSCAITAFGLVAGAALFVAEQSSGYYAVKVLGWGGAGAALFTVIAASIYRRKYVAAITASTPSAIGYDKTAPEAETSASHSHSAAVDPTDIAHGQSKTVGIIIFVLILLGVLIVLGQRM